MLRSTLPDVQADNAAVVRIAYNAKAGTLRVLIDEKNTGNFRECINESVPMELGWNKYAFYYSNHHEQECLYWFVFYDRSTC